jgi:glycosyltransferase involved in cell wall biosynthesis
MLTQPIEKAPVSVALCITELDVGGAEQALVELATRLDRHRFTPVVYALSQPTNERATLPLRLREAGIETHFLGGRHVGHLPFIIRRLARHLKRQRPSLLLSFLFHANFVARLAARAAGVPVVLSGIRVAEHGVWWHRWIDQLTSRLVDRHVCVSQAVAEFSARRTRLPANRLVVIPNGVDVARFQHAMPLDLTELGLAVGRRAVTYVGRLDHQKAIPELIAHSPSWLDRLPDHDLLLVGAGPQADELRALAQRSGIADRVHFTGWRDDVPRILRASDLFVLPSRWEGMPNALLEAMAAGLPVVATDVEGVRELLGPAANEQVVAPADWPGLAHRLAKLAGDRERASRLGRVNQVRAADFSWQAMVAAYESLFSSFVGG